MKYTIKELIDKAFDKNRLYNKFRDKFTEDDINYAIDTQDKYQLYVMMGNKFNKNNIMRALDKEEYIHILIRETNIEMWDKKLIEHVINITNHISDLKCLERKLDSLFDDRLTNLFNEKMNTYILTY